MGNNWTREQVILTLYLYCQIPFGKCSQRTPEVVELANLIGRSPGAVSFKLGNLGHFDLKLRARGVGGLANASKLDQEIWNEFSGNWDKLVDEAQSILSTMTEGSKPESEILQIPEPETTEREAIVKQRVGQDFFRRAVLSSYENRCCATGIEIPRILVASHIVPWKDNIKERLNPSNGLALSPFFDKVFDLGLMTLDEEYQMIFSDLLLKKPNDHIKEIHAKYHHKQIQLPTRFQPDQELLEWHRTEKFGKVI